MKNTVKLFSMMILAAGLMMVQPVSAQTKKDQKKENKELKKDQQEQRNAVFKNSPKSAMKEAKKYERNGWKTMGMPIAKQLEETWLKMADKDPNGYPRYIFATELATGNSYAAAQSQADNVAKLRIASQVSTSVNALVDVALANQEISAKEAASITKTVESSKMLVSQKLGRTFKTLEMYQELSNHNYRVSIAMFYDMKAAIAITRDVLLRELQKETDVKKAQLEKMMGMENLIDQVAKDMPEYDEIAE